MDSFFQIFQNEIAQNNFSYLALLLAFLGGVVASVSPCSLGILPIIIGYIGGYNKEDNKTTIFQLFFFIVGMSLVLSLIGVICAYTGTVFTAVLGPVGVLILSSVIMLMGLNLIGVLELNMPVLIKQFPQNKGSNVILYPFVVGAIFALAASPCSTPILAGIMALASLTKNLIFSALLLFLFSIGQGLIIVVAGLFTSVIKNLKGFAKFSEILMKLSGWVLIMAALFLYYKVYSPFIHF